MITFAYLKTTTMKENILNHVVVLEGEPTEWLVLEDNGDRIFVKAINTDLSIPPTERCSKRFIVKVSDEPITQ